MRGSTRHNSFIYNLYRVYSRGLNLRETNAECDHGGVMEAECHRLWVACQEVFNPIAGGEGDLQFQQFDDENI